MRTSLASAAASVAIVGMACYYFYTCPMSWYSYLLIASLLAALIALLSTPYLFYCANPSYAGASLYPRYGLYEIVVLFNCLFAWGISPGRILGHYLEFTKGSTRHAEVGLASAQLVTASIPRATPVVLIDVVPEFLAEGETVLARNGFASISAVCQDILQPLPPEGLPGGPCDSIAMNAVLQCIPGSFREKGAAFVNLKRGLAPSGVLFGITILAGPHNWFGKLVMWYFNATRVFDNRKDTAAELEKALRAAFEHVSVKVVGPTAFFAASDNESIDLERYHASLE